jgi:tyrosinase
MSQLYSSTNDPLFWIHHGGIDNFWWRWQGRNETRLKDVTRTIVQFLQVGEEAPANVTNGFTSLDSDLFMVGDFAPVVKFRQLVDTLDVDGEGLLCYTYDSDSYDTVP